MFFVKHLLPHLIRNESATLNWTIKIRSSRLTTKFGHTAYCHKRSILETLRGEAGMLALSAGPGVLISWLPGRESMSAEAPCQVSALFHCCCSLRYPYLVKERLT